MTTSNPTQSNPLLITDLSQMILPTQIKNKVNLIIKASKATGRLPGHILMDGLSGGGKTTLTNALTNELPNITCASYSVGNCNDARKEDGICPYKLPTATSLS